MSRLSSTGYPRNEGSPVARDVRNILNLPPDNIADALAQSGAMNAQPPIIHSSHLKNVKTGVVLPWNTLLAEQRDIMVPCDATGDTSEEAWRRTVVEQDDESEKMKLYWAAHQSVCQQSMDITKTYHQDSHESTIPRNQVKFSDAKSLDEYLTELQNSPTEPSSGVDEQLEMLSRDLGV